MVKNIPPEYVTRPDAVRLAMRRTGVAKGKGPALIFLPGYMSDMMGAKALALEEWAARNNRAMIRFDYAGCGESDGAFADFTLDDWLADVLLTIDLVIRGPVILVGSSMGGWLMLLAALARPSDVVGLVGIAAAPDFTQWGFTDDEKMRLHRDGILSEVSPYSDAPYVTTLKFWQSGQRHLVSERLSDISCPTTLIHGQADADVPWQLSVDTAAALGSATSDSKTSGSSAVQTVLITDGDHRLSRPQDIAQICASVAALYDRISRP